MEAQTWVAYGLFSVIFVYLINHLCRGNHKLNLPPGPKPWPIIGNFDLIGPLPHHSIHELSKIYGPIMTLKFGSVPVIVGSSVEMAKSILKTNDEIFAGRPTTAAGKYTTYNYSNMTWSHYGPYFRQARKLWSMHLFSAKSLESYEYIRVEEHNSLLRSIFNTNGEPITLKDYLSKLSLNVISRVVLGKRYLDKCNDNDVDGQVNKIDDEFSLMLDELFILNGVLNLGDWIPCVKYLDIQGYEKRMKIIGKKFERFMEHVLDEHNARRENEKDNWVPKDMVDVLLQHGNDSNHQVKIDRNGVKAFTQDLIAGGTDTSTITLEWAITELIRRPDIIAKATEELDHVIGKERWVQEQDIQNLPYIQAIVKETLRLHPVTPLLVPRFSREQVKVEGYDIPKGSVALVNTFTIHRDPSVYDKPLEFWPDRFIDKDIDVKSQDFEFLPFGSGRRKCPGYNLGLKIVEPGLANLLHGFEWKLPDNIKPQDMDMEEIFGLTNPKKTPVVVCAQPRLPHYIYCK
ncbi:flavonoid 3'-monooxygenase-like [Chenopodium quinoa]|uniref:Cytochrome P450 n=1 Tax=Chenopodium quinoa TaxID=63459 RepID=A0A803L233_CHEQI|nr:flavonoid 3'-monooxygenase-like [Chenopodium quinoa]